MQAHAASNRTPYSNLALQETPADQSLEDELIPWQFMTTPSTAGGTRRANACKHTPRRSVLGRAPKLQQQRRRSNFEATCTAADSSVKAKERSCQRRPCSELAR